MRRYRGYLADSARWEAVELRAGDIVISTPSKSGTTWMQTMVAMLVLGRVDLGTPLSTISPWVDMLVRPLDELVDLLGAQTHRRFVKTHTPLDGVPERDDVIYLTVFRHPFDVVLSDRDHSANTARERVRELRTGAVGDDDLAELADRATPPEAPADHLRWFLDCDEAPTGTGPNSLADLCEQLGEAWCRRHRPNVHLFHYAELWADLPTQFRRLADVLDIEVPEDRWPTLVQAATLDAMRTRVDEVVPHATDGFWTSGADFLRQGGRRDWAELLDEADVDHLRDRTTELVGQDAASWLLDT